MEKKKTMFKEEEEVRKNIIKFKDGKMKRLQIKNQNKIKITKIKILKKMNLKIKFQIIKI